jgi:chemotaxis protein CheX
MSKFTKEELKTALKIGCPGQLDGEAAQEFNAQSKAWMLSPVNQFVLDMHGVALLTRDFYRAIIQFKTVLKRDEKTLNTINIIPALLSQIKMDGMELAFNPIASLGVLEKPAAKSPIPNVNVDFINPFLLATKNTLEIQCNTKIEIGKPFLKKSQLPNVAIVGVISLASKGFQGSVVLSFTEIMFLKIYKNMFDEMHDKLTPEIVDAAGELLNMIYGSAKTELNSKGYDFQKALPTVLAGEQLSVRQAGIKPAVVIPFITDSGSFHLEIEFENALEAKNV